MTSTTLREMLVKQEPRSVSSCYVCSGPRAEYVVCSKPYGDNPFFPFLEQHQPPEGAESVRSDGRVWVCSICYAFLNQQWNAFEKNKTPYTQRIYWLKRLDRGPFAGMDVNLQQDYESLFEASCSGIESDTRKGKQVRNQYSSNSNVIKPKSTEYSDTTFPSTFGFQVQGSEKSNIISGSILDLSVSTRTSSRSSSTTSPGVVSEVCYTCSQEAKSLINVYVNAIPHCPFFPSLRTLPKPIRAKPIDVDSSIRVCKQCHLSLFNQWEFYQKQNVPHQDRIYKISNFFVPNENVPTGLPKDKTFVCYTCGMVTQLSVQRFINAFPDKEGDPFFSFLLQTPPHHGANKLSSGKACVCSVCYKSLYRQFRVYEVSNTPEERRKYKILNENVLDNGSVLRQHLEGTSQDKTLESKIMCYQCYLCESPSESFFHVSTVPIDDMYFPFIRSLPKPPNAIPMDIHGQVNICNQCHNSLKYQWQAFEHASIPINQRQFKIPFSKSMAELSHTNSIYVPPAQSSVVEDHELLRKSSVDKCGLCEKSFNQETTYYLETLPREKCMHFPSLPSLVKPNSNSIDQYGRIISCSQCYMLLKNQWEIFESAHVPHSQRQYDICPTKAERDHILQFSNESRLSEASAALHIQVSSPDLKIDLSKHSSNEPLLTTVNTMPVSSITLTNAPISALEKSSHLADLKVSMKGNSDEQVTRICGPLDIPYVRPLILVPFSCYVCGEMNSSGLTFAIKSQPVPNVRTEKSEDCVPFFPFLSKHTPPEGAEKLTNDGSALVCMFCYQSLISQWYAYEASPYSEDENPWHRRYNTHNYVCYICGITTYRKRVCSISVKNFPFLLEHKRPNGALTVLNGDCVVTCQTCFESITSQWKDFERMKVPVEMRKYNWIVMPPPPDDENSRGCQILQENSGSGLSLQQSDSDQTNMDESGIPHGLKPSQPHMGLPAPYGLAKPVNHNVMSPVHQGNTHSNTAFSPFPGNMNHALNATRASSFAAALRKLAKQAVDPVAEKELSPISPASSPASSQHSNHSRPPASMSMYMNSHNPNVPGHGSPTPMHSSSHGKVLDLGRYSNSSRNGNMGEPAMKLDNSKIISSSSDKRNDMGGMKHGPPPAVPHNMRPENNLTRGFQPYRNSEERHPTPPHMYNPSPPPSTMGGYVYHHPSLVQSSQIPAQSYRLEESVYMERYGLLRPSTMPYPPPTTNLISHPRAPHYPASQYPPELISQSMRLTPSNSSTYTSNRYSQEEENAKENNMLRQREIEMFRERERYEREEAENREREEAFFREKRNHMRHSPISHPHSLSRSEVNEDKNLMGSIIHGTPRDYARSLSPVSSSAPLNLATNVHMESAMTLKEDYSSKQSRQNNNSLMNGQLHQRNTNHHASVNYYRKEPDISSHRMQYQMTVSREKESQLPVQTEASENKPSIPSRSKVASYYMERENKNSNTFETRTLSMASVINSQINGIFAREKFPSNNSFDYLNSFVAKSEKSPDNQSKGESEHKKAFSGQENFPISSKVSDSEKMHSIESLKNESLSNKLPSFMYSESQVTFRPEPSEFSENYKMADLSLARTQLQNHETPSSHENNTRCADELQKIVSTLDAREERLRKLRLIGDIADSDESDIDSDHEDPEKLRVLLTITKGPPPKLDLDPLKIKFLSKVNLITHSKKQAIELRKCIRRHQALREKSASPIDLKPITEPEIEYNIEHLSELAKRLCLEGDFQHKTEFLQSLGLTFVAPEQKEEKEKVDKVILQDKLRRNGSLRSDEDSFTSQNSLLGKRDYPDFNNLKSETVKKPHLNQDESVNDGVDRPFSEKKFISLSMRDSSQQLPPLQRKISSFLKPPMKTVNIPVPPLIPTNQIIPPLIETNPDKGAVIAPKDPRVRQINKEFVQEFHNSVLQTTQMQLEKKNVSSTGVVEHTFYNKTAAEEEIAEKSELYSVDRPLFRWPGIEAIMESYECHISEQTVEKNFLLESCHKLKVLNQEFNIEVECLQKRSEELMQEKMYLDTERRELQKRIESLKLFIERFR